MDGRQAPSVEETDPRLPYEAQAKRGEAGTSTKLLVGLDDACEADLVASEILDLKSKGVPLKDQTVLARTNARLDALAKQLADRGIMTLHLGSFFERDEVRDLLSVLALVAEPNGAALVRVAAFREVGVHATDIAVAFHSARERGLPLVTALVGAAEIPGLSPAGAASLTSLGKRLDEVDAAHSRIRDHRELVARAQRLPSRDLAQTGDRGRAQSCGALAGSGVLRPDRLGRGSLSTPARYFGVCARSCCCQTIETCASLGSVLRRTECAS